MDCATAKIYFIVNIVVAILSMDHVGQVCSSVHVVIHVVCVVIEARTFVSYDRFFKFDFILKAYLRKFVQDETDTLSEALFQFLWRHIQV